MRNNFFFGTCVLWLFAPIAPSFAQPKFSDQTFPSAVFGEARNYRIFLPTDYNSENQSKRYPVIYYFHGHSDRYTLERYDAGKDTVPKIARYVAQNDVIVVAVDGWVKEHYEGFYGGSPWDVRRDGGDYDFGEYFLEMVTHIDATFRTKTTRRYRASSGLSMGGFMSLYLSARYPDLLGSASAFNPGPEFFTGNKGTRMLWRPKDHVACHRHSKIQLVRASGDYISQYHEETRAAYAHANNVDFEYRRDEYHRHWATSIAKTFDFHQRAFNTASLDTPPDKWHYVSAYRDFKAWGYEVHAAGKEKAFVTLHDVQANGLRVTTRQWAPDGPPATNKKITLLTSPRYQPLQKYKIADLRLSDKVATWREVKADASGRIELQVDGAGHQLSLLGPGIEPPRVTLLPATTKDALRLGPNQVQSLPIRIYNPGDKPLNNVRIELASKYPTVDLQKASTKFPRLEPGEVVEAGEGLQVRFAADGRYFARTRLDITLSAEAQPPQTVPLDILVIPEQISPPTEVELLDGRTVTFSVFRQKGNQGGGAPIERTVTEGQGNGDGLLQPGEEATLWVKTAQGLDPLDKNNWHRTKIYTDSPWLIECRDLQEQKQREWTGAKERTSVVRLAADTPPGTTIPLLLDNETWSFHYTPDIRFGQERLYQAFQQHKHHLHRYQLKAAASEQLKP